MAIFDELKSIGRVLQEAGKIEQYQQILETQEKLLEMQKRINDLTEKNKKLEEDFKIKQTLISDGNLYWTEGTENRDGPFCTRCWDADHNLIRLHRSSVSSRVSCPNCDVVVKSGTARIIRR